MFKQLFQSMHELLDEIAGDYPTATGLKKTVLEEKLTLLKKNERYLRGRMAAVRRKKWAK